MTYAGGLAAAAVKVAGSAISARATLHYELVPR